MQAAKGGDGNAPFVWRQEQRSRDAVGMRLWEMWMLIVRGRMLSRVARHERLRGGAHIACGVACSVHCRLHSAHTQGTTHPGSSTQKRNRSLRQSTQTHPARQAEDPSLSSTLSHLCTQLPSYVLLTRARRFFIWVSAGQLALDSAA